MDVEAAKELFYRPSDERTVLSICLRDIDHFYDLSTKLTASDFLGKEHQIMFVLMNSLIESGVSKIDLPMLITKAQNDGVIDMIGGVSYIQSIFNIDASSDNFTHYINDLLEASTKYKAFISLSSSLDSFVENAQSGESSDSLINKVEISLLDMTFRNTLTENPIRFGDGLSEYIDERKDSKITMSGLSSGFPIFDKQIDGLIPGTLTIIGARKKMGKSAFLTNMALHNAYRMGVGVLYIDTELTFYEFSSRALSILSGVKERDIKHGGYTPEDYRSLKSAQKLINKGKLFHKYMPGFTIESVVALCKKYHLKEKIGLIFFDYLKEPSIDSTPQGRKEYQILGDITTKMKDLAGILNIPIVSAVQLNRSGIVADSDKVSRFSDILAFWSVRTEDERRLCGPEGGQYKLTIKDTRRGGSTPEEGIGYFFFKDRILIREVKAPDQFFMSGGNETVDDNIGELYSDEYNPYIQESTGTELT